MSKKPLVLAQAKDAVAGEVREDPQFIVGQGEDLTYVPGYSDKRQRIDDCLRRKVTPDVSLGFRLHWCPTQRVGGRPDMQKATQLMAMGYRRLPKNEMEGLGLGWPLAARETADGGVAVGDSELFICDGPRAQKNLEAGRRAIADRSTDEQTAAELHRAGAGIAGAAVTSHTEQRTDNVPVSG